MKRRALAASALAVLMLSAPVSAPEGQASPARRGLAVGQQPPALSVKDLEGRPYSLERLAKEKDVVVLHFWATWCPYCRAEIPGLARIHNELAAKGVTVLAVSVDDNLSALRRFVAGNKLPYPVIPDVEQGFELADGYAVEGIPITYLIGRDGLIVSHMGGKSGLFESVKRLAEARTTGT
jgi:peroxiredoxin